MADSEVHDHHNSHEDHHNSHEDHHNSHEDHHNSHELMAQHILFGKYTTYRRMEQDKTRTIMHAQPIKNNHSSTPTITLILP